MKIIFFSDAHGNQYTVKELFNQLTVEKPDVLIFGGDIFGYYYGQSEILSLLRTSQCICLLGNHDRYFLDLLEGKINENYLVSRYGLTYQYVLDGISDRDVKFLYSLDNRYDMVVDGLHLVFVHGSIEDPLNGRIYPDTVIENYEPYYGIDYVFMGHTHHKIISELPNGTILLNPGSIGQQRDGKGCTYLMFDTSRRCYTFRKVQYDKNSLVAEIKEHNETKEMERKLIEVLYRKVHN